MSAEQEFLVEVKASKAISETKKLEKEFNDLTKSGNKLDKSTDKIKKGFSGLKSAAGPLAASLGALFSIATIKSSLDFADNIGKVSDKLGISTDALQEFRFAGNLVGVEANNMDNSIQRFARRLGEAEAGTGVLKTVLDDLGISIHDSSGNMRDTNDILGEYADAIMNAESSQERLMLSVKAFDIGGASMINMLKDGKEGLDKLRQAARDAGAVLDEDLIRSAESINDEWTKVSTLFSTKFKSAMLTATQSVGDFFGIFEDSASKTREIESLTAKIAAEQEKLNSVMEDGIFLVELRTKNHAHNIDVWKEEREQLVKQVDSLAKIDEAKKKAVESTNKLVDASEAHKKALEKENETLAEQESAYQSLIERLFPVEQQKKQLEEEERLLSRALDNGTISWSRYADAVERLRPPEEEQIRLMEEQISTADVLSTSYEGLSNSVDSATKSTNELVGASKSLANTTTTQGSGFTTSGTYNADQAKLHPNYDFGKATSDSKFGNSSRSFAQGGSFIVSGNGGPDSQNVSFRATPGETVSVGKKDAGGTVNNNNGKVTIIMNGVNDVKSFAKQLADYSRTNPLSFNLSDRGVVAG